MKKLIEIDKELWDRFARFADEHFANPETEIEAFISEYLDQQADFEDLITAPRPNTGSDRVDQLGELIEILKSVGSTPYEEWFKGILTPRFEAADHGSAREKVVWKSDEDVAGWPSY